MIRSARAQCRCADACLHDRAQPALAQSHTSHELPVVAAALLERPVALDPGIGRAHDTVTTESQEAQQFYDQGLAYLHHFHWIDAARSFNQALRHDARLALAHIGLSCAHEALNQSAAARAALARARELADRVTEHERRHIVARERQLAGTAAPLDGARMSAYRQALDDALAQFPSDAELWLQRGVAESPDITDRGKAAPPAAFVSTSERSRSPGHFAAHHYLTHAYENSGRIDDALRNGAVYARSAPASLTRATCTATTSGASAAGGGDCRVRAANRLKPPPSRSKAPTEYDWHYEHNLDVLGTSYQYTGRIARAEAMLKEAFALPTANLTQADNKRQWPAFLRARGRFDEALAAAGTLNGHPHPVVQAIGHIEVDMGF